MRQSLSELVLVSRRVLSLRGVVRGSLLTMYPWIPNLQIVHVRGARLLHAPLAECILKARSSKLDLVDHDLYVTIRL